MSDTGSSTHNTHPKKRAKVWYQQTFKSEWLDDPELCKWVKPDRANKYTVICTVCDCKLKNCNNSSLLHHNVSAKHGKNLSANIITVSIEKFAQKK